MSQTISERPWLTLKEMAVRLDLPVGTIRKLRATGKAPRAVMMGRQLRFHVDDVTRWELERREASA
jgi:excisionase family DNA binding protein